MEKTVERFKQYLYKNYFSYWIVLFMDVFLSMASALATMSFVSNFIIHIAKDAFLMLLFSAGFFSFIIFYFLKVHKNIIRHASIRSIGNIVFALFIKDICLLAVVVFGGKWFGFQFVLVCCFIDFLISIAALVGFRVALLVIYDLIVSQISSRKTRVLVYGTDEKSVALQQRLYTSKHFQVVGYVNPRENLKSYKITGLSVYYFMNEVNFSHFVDKYNIGGLIFPSYETVQDESEKLVQYCQNIGIKNLVSPPIVGSGRAALLNRLILISFPSRWESRHQFLHSVPDLVYDF